MASSATNFALIGRSYPGEMFESWAEVSRSVRARRQPRHARRAADQHWSRQSFPRQEAWPARTA